MNRVLKSVWMVFKGQLIDAFQQHAVAKVYRLRDLLIVDYILCWSSESLIVREHIEQRVQFVCIKVQKFA